MENPEEVLQALDEFKKMRPSEIPRELEEYLSWVAKTGDPVYQWSLVKPLFREKLTRVMTDFYESCPSLELAPCPNVEQFNYDIMKCNLLELLESFGNAPFTVQRICELLTSPRKEYNRVDKFMRAMEKNILVVSTIEPGPAARRSENGDGMVNGSLDDETPNTQPSHEVEMESWVKECTTESSVAIASRDSETPLPDTVIPASKAARIATNEEILQIREKSQEPAQRAEIADSESESHEIATDSIEPVQNTEEAGLRVENLPGNRIETGVPVASEVPETVMNEDTSSQPSLDSETEDSESASSRKHQTTFRTKDFAKKGDELSGKLYEKVAKSETEKRRIDDEPDLEAGSITNNEVETLKSMSETKLSFECQEIPAAADGAPEKRARIDRLINDLETIESNCIADVDESSTKKDFSVVVESKREDSTDFLVTSVVATTIETTMTMTTTTRRRSTDSEIDAKTVEIMESSEERLSSVESEKVENQEEDEEETRREEATTDSADDSLPEAERTSETTEQNPRPIVEEPSFDEESAEEQRDVTSETSGEQEESGVTIEEAMDDDTRISKSIIPDPIPIIEEPKDPETPSKRDTEITTIITELPEITKDLTEEITDAEEIRETIDSTIVVGESSSIETISPVIPIVREASQDDITDVRCPEETTIDEKIEPAESMEVDGEESLPAFQQDEPMEQEPGDMVKS